MSWKRTSSLLAAVLVSGLALTACGGSGSDAKGGTTSAPTRSAPAADATKGPADVGSGTGKVAPPKDLPAGMPLPSGELTSVTGDTGAYFLTYRTDNSAGILDEYRTALEGKGYTVVDIAGTFSATKGATAVSVTTSADTVVVSVAGS